MVFSMPGGLCRRRANSSVDGKLIEADPLSPASTMADTASSASESSSEDAVTPRSVVATPRRSGMALSRRVSSCALSLPDEDSATLTTFQLPSLIAGSRVRKSCYFESTVRCGVTGFTVYNHMLLPTVYETVDVEYDNLCTNVNLWDVAAERQIELVGTDALTLAEMLTPRAIGSMKVGEARYAVLTDDEGGVLNDPVLLRLAADRFWLSIADNDVVLWVKALARGLDVRVFEAAVSPLAVQGPKALALISELFGDWVADLKYFHFRETQLDGIPLLVCRSGWSPERGYELFLQDESRGNELWGRVWEAGQKHGILPGVPHQVRRMEGGMLSHGADLSSGHNVLEMGLPEKWVKLDKQRPFCGQKAVERLLAEGGPRRRIVGVRVEADAAVCAPLIRPWSVLSGEEPVGQVTSFCFSKTLNAYIGIATLPTAVAVPETRVTIETPSGHRLATVHKLPFMPRVS